MATPIYLRHTADLRDLLALRVEENRADQNPMNLCLKTSRTLLGEAEAWAWSGAAAHCGAKSRNEALDLELWRKSWTVIACRQCRFCKG